MVLTGIGSHGGPVGRCRGLYADVPGSNFGAGTFSFFSEKNLFFSFRI